VPHCFTAFLTWPLKRWLVAIFTALLTVFVIGIPTAVLPTPFFGRAVAVTSWSVPVLIATSILTGLLIATYVKTEPLDQEQKSLKVGGLGGFFSFIAVGCPVCNKIALLALGSTGAVRFFAPIQPYIATAVIALLFYAVRKRVLSESMCSVKITNYPMRRKKVGL
jgi:hypothetical protein